MQPGVDLKPKPRKKRKLNTAATRRREVNRLVDLTKTGVGVYHFRRVDLSGND